MSLINYETNQILTQSTDWAISFATRETKFAITNTKLYVPVVTLLTQDNTKLLKQLKSGFKRAINRTKYQSKVPIERGNGYLDYSVDPSFQGVSKRFVLSFEDNTIRARHTRYSLPTVEIKDYSVMVDEQNPFDQLVKNDLKTCDNIKKIATDRGDHYKTYCLLDYLYF